MSFQKITSCFILKLKTVLQPSNVSASFSHQSIHTSTFKIFVGLFEYNTSNSNYLFRRNRNVNSTCLTFFSILFCLPYYFINYLKFLIANWTHFLWRGSIKLPLSVCLSVCGSFCLSVCLCVCLCIPPSVWHFLKNVSLISF